MARSGNNARIPKIGTYLATSGATFAADLTGLANDVAQVINEYVSTPGELPLTGNWPCRTITAISNFAQYMWVNNGWRRMTPNGFQFSGSTSGSGILPVAHNFGSAPRWIHVTMQNSKNEALAKILSPIVWDTEIGPESVQIRFRRTDIDDWAGDQPVVGFMLVGN